MKKLISIMILSLLLSSCAMSYAPSHYRNQQYYVKQNLGRSLLLGLAYAITDYVLLNDGYYYQNNRRLDYYYSGNLSQYFYNNNYYCYAYGNNICTLRGIGHRHFYNNNYRQVYSASRVTNKYYFNSRQKYYRNEKRSFILRKRN